MYCTKCGTEIPDSAKVCPRCGYPVRTRQGADSNRTGGRQPSEEYQPPENDGTVYETTEQTSRRTHLRNRLIGMGAVAVVVIAVAAAVLRLTGVGFEQPVKRFITGCFEGDFEQVLEAVPDQVVGYVIDKMGLQNVDAFVGTMNGFLQKSLDEAGNLLGENWDYSYEIVEENDFSQEEIQNFNQKMDAIGLEELQADEGKSIRVEVRLESEDGENSEENTTIVDVVKIGGRWYLANLNF